MEYMAMVHQSRADYCKTTASSYLAQHVPLVYMALAVSMLNDVFCLELFPSPANLTPTHPPTYQS